MNQHTKDKIIGKITDVLRNAKFFMVPLESIKDTLTEDQEILNNLSNDELLEIIREQEKFRLFKSPGVELSPEMKKIVSEGELQKMGFCNSPRVMLQERVPTKKELIEFLLSKANQTFTTLKKAWDIRPEKNQQIEDQLLKALAKSQKLQRELKSVCTAEEKVEKAVVD